MTLAFLLWTVLRIDGARATDGVDDIGELLAALCAALICGGAVQRVSVGRTSWALLAASSLSWAIGEWLWSYYDLIKGVQVPFPSLADAGFLAAIPSGVRRAPALSELAPTHLLSRPGPP
jgi:diguanylate cyclase